MYPNLLAEMSRSGVTSEKMAGGIGINPSTMSAKLNNMDRIKLAEAVKIRDKFFPNLALDYLFSSVPMNPVYMNRPA